MKKKKNYVFIFDCVECGNFYGEQALTKEGKLLCPSCLSEVWKDSDYVEKMEVSYVVVPFDPSEVEGGWA